jgi:hypothetical protein
VFRVRVMATQEEITLIAKAARKQRLSAPQFVSRVTKSLARSLKARKMPRRGVASPGKTESLRRKPKS